MRKLVDCTGMRPALKYGARIHLFKESPAIFDLLSGNDFESLGLGKRIFATVRFDIANNHVDSLGFQFMRILQHLVSLTDARGIAHVDLERATLMLRHSDYYCGKIRRSIPRAR